MNFRIVFFVVLFPVFLNAQSSNSFLKGFSIEIGAIYPSLSWDSNDRIGVGDKSKLWLKPSLRFLYSYTSKDNFRVKSFIGYFSIGGHSKEYDNGYKDKIVINSFEIGSFILYTIKKFEFGFGLKWNKHIDATQYYWGHYWNDIAPKKWNRVNAESFFKNSSFDWGLRISYLFKYGINISTEYWSSMDDIESDLLAKDNHVRNKSFNLSVGYNF